MWQNLPKKTEELLIRDNVEIYSLSENNNDVVIKQTINLKNAIGLITCNSLFYIPVVTVNSDNLEQLQFQNCVKYSVLRVLFYVALFYCIENYLSIKTIIFILHYKTLILNSSFSIWHLLVA